MTHIANYAVIAKSRDELASYMNNHDKFTSVMQHDLSWFTDLGFTPCEIYTENTEYSRNYYKVFGNEILLLNLRTQDILEGQFYIRKKIRLVNNEVVMEYLHSAEGFKNPECANVIPHCVVTSDDIKYPSLISYLSIRIEDYYYDNGPKYKKIITYVNVDEVEFIQESCSNFYLSNVLFRDERLEIFKVMTDGIERDGAMLSEFIEDEPTVYDFFDYDKQFDNNIKFLFSALVI